MLKASGLKKCFMNGHINTSILKGIDLEVKEGEFVGIMGPSGAGKTTLLNVLSTIDKPTSGSVLVNGEEVTKINDKQLSKFRLNNIGFVFQDFNLIDNMSIIDNISLPLVLNNKKYKEIKNKAYELAELLGIFEQIDKYPYQLSGGQKQRVATARALISSPKILFADEPTGALDTKSSRDLLNAFSIVNKEKNTTIFMVTHDANAASYCDKVIFIKDGELYLDIYNTGDRQTFYQKILNNLSVIGN